jgi:hypothetical protein
MKFHRGWRALVDSAVENTGKNGSQFLHDFFATP